MKTFVCVCGLCHVSHKAQKRGGWLGLLLFFYKHILRIYMYILLLQRTLIKHMAYCIPHTKYNIYGASHPCGFPPVRVYQRSPLELPLPLPPFYGERAATKQGAMTSTKSKIAICMIQARCPPPLPRCPGGGRCPGALMSTNSGLSTSPAMDRAQLCPPRICLG